MNLESKLSKEDIGFVAQKTGGESLADKPKTVAEFSVDEKRYAELFKISKS